ncbi:MAG: ABC transporter permease subunit [Thermocrispum sp.]
MTEKVDAAGKRQVHGGKPNGRGTSEMPPLVVPLQLGGARLLTGDVVDVELRGEKVVAVASPGQLPPPAVGDRLELSDYLLVPAPAEPHAHLDKALTAAHVSNPSKDLPYAVVLQTTPILALVPLFGFWFGFGFASRVLVCVLIAVFPLIANTLFGLRSVDRGQLEMFRLHDAGRRARLWKLQLPAALPAMFAGLRISAGLSVIGAIVGDFFFKQGEPGIGLLIDVYRSRLQTEQMFAAVLCASFFGIFVFWFFGYLARRVVGSWHESARHHTVSLD